MNLRLLLAVIAAVSACAYARDWQLDEGHWQIELSGYGGVYSGKTDRDHDGYLTGTVDYEFPAFQRVSLALRLRPLFVYLQDENDDDDSDTIWGTGAGLVARMYQNSEDMNGWYGELGGGVIWHSRYFEGNDSRINFISELGVGYLFPKSNWNIALRAQHLSNGGLGSDNAGVNAIGIAVGYRF